MSIGFLAELIIAYQGRDDGHVFDRRSDTASRFQGHLTPEGVESFIARAAMDSA